MNSLKRKFLMIAAFGVSIGVLISLTYIEIGLKQMPQQIRFIRDLTDLDKWKLHLLNEVYKNGLTLRDFKKLNEVNECESNWRQFDKKGNVIISNGNIGIAQINKIAHQQEYIELGLNINEPFDNLTYQVLIYKREGLKPWRQWSGHCWEKKINKF